MAHLDAVFVPPPYPFITPESATSGTRGMEVIDMKGDQHLRDS